MAGPAAHVAAGGDRLWLQAANTCVDGVPRTDAGVWGSLLLLQGRTTPQAATEAYDKHKEAQTQVSTAARQLRQRERCAQCMQCWFDVVTSYITAHTLLCPSCPLPVPACLRRPC